MRMRIYRFPSMDHFLVCGLLLVTVRLSAYFIYETSLYINLVCVKGLKYMEFIYSILRRSKLTLIMIISLIFEITHVVGIR